MRGAVKSWSVPDPGLVVDLGLGGDRAAISWHLSHLVEAAVGFEMVQAALDVLGVGQEAVEEREQEAIVRRKVRTVRGRMPNGPLGTRS